MFKDAWDLAYFSQVVILLNAKFNCFISVFLRGCDNKCPVGEGKPGNQPGDLQAGKKMKSVVSADPSIL